MINSKNAEIFNNHLDFLKSNFVPIMEKVCVGYTCKCCNETVKADYLDYHLSHCKAKQESRKL